MKDERLSNIWKGMKARCQTASHADYPKYGARGIWVSEDWQTFTGFAAWATASGYRAGLELDRRNVDGPYSPANCRWIPKSLNVARRWLPRDGAYLDQFEGLLTDELVEMAEARGTSYKLRDGKGLYLYVGVRGTRSWRCKFRFEGKERLLTIGQYPELTLENARELHLAARTRLKARRNPARIKQESKRRRIRRGGTSTK